MKQTGIGLVELVELAASLDADTFAVAFVGFREHAIASGDSKSRRRESMFETQPTRGARIKQAFERPNFWIGLPDARATR